MALTGALCALFAAAVVITATREDLQRPDWRGVASQLGAAGEPRLIVGPRNSDQPLDLYLPGSRQLGDQTAAVREVVILWRAASQAVAFPPSAAFRRIEERSVGRFRFATFRAARPVALSSRALAAVAGGDSAAGPAEVVLQEPVSR